MLGVSDPSTKYLRTAKWYHLYHYLNHSILASAVSSWFMWDGRPKGPNHQSQNGHFMKEAPHQSMGQPKTSQNVNIRIYLSGSQMNTLIPGCFQKFIISIIFPSSFWTASTAVRMVEAWRRPDAFTFSSLLAACHRSQRWEVAQGLLRDMPLTQAQELHSLGNPKVWDCVDSDCFLMVWCFMWFANI